MRLTDLVLSLLDLLHVFDVLDLVSIVSVLLQVFSAPFFRLLLQLRLVLFGLLLKPFAFLPIFVFCSFELFLVVMYSLKSIYFVAHCLAYFRFCFPVLMNS